MKLTYLPQVGMTGFILIFFCPPAGGHTGFNIEKASQGSLFVKKCGTLGCF